MREAAALMADGMPQAMAQKRSPFAPALGTLAEAGLGLRDFEVVGWTGLLAPASTPRSLVERLNTEAVRAMQSTSMKDLLAAQSLRPFPPHGPDDFGTYIREELAKWRAMARIAGVEASM